MSNKVKHKTSISVKIASLVWIGLGILLIFSAVLTAFLGFNNNTGVLLRVGIAIGIGVLGFLFLYAGVRAFMGKAKGTLGNGIFGILFGLLWIWSNSHNGNNVLIGLAMIASGIVFVVSHVKNRNVRPAETC